MHDADVVDRNAEPFRNHLSKRRFVALAVLMTPGEDFDRTRWIDAHFGRFPQPYASAERAHRLARRDAARLDVGREADPAQLAVTAGFALALAEAFEVGKF